MALDVETLKTLLELAENKSTASKEVKWRWKEYLTPKVFHYLYMGMDRDKAEAAAIAAGEYLATRRYEVSLDGGNTWIQAPSDMPVLDINGKDMPEDRRKTGKPSDAAKVEM